MKDYWGEALLFLGSRAVALDRRRLVGRRGSTVSNMHVVLELARKARNVLVRSARHEDLGDLGGQRKLVVRLGVHDHRGRRETDVWVDSLQHAGFILSTAARCCAVAQMTL